MEIGFEEAFASNYHLGLSSPIKHICGRFSVSFTTDWH